jgi:hypothetical protein
MSHQLTIVIYNKMYAICRLEPSAPVPAWAGGGRFLSITRTVNELSIICEEVMVPDDVHGERNRRLMRLEGTMPFTLPGVLASVTAPLADAGISVSAISTYDTDYLLIADGDLQQATQALESTGHTIQQSLSD